MELKATMPLARPPMPPAAAAPVFCKDCMHFNDKVFKDPAKCMAPGTQTISLVYGQQPVTCTEARSERINGVCGREGKLFIQAGGCEVPDPIRHTREPYSKPAPSADNRSSLSNMNRASVQSSAITVATASAEHPGPNTD